MRPASALSPSLSRALSPAGSFNQYLARVRAIEPLTPDAERRLHERYAAGDADAGEELVLANLRAVIKVALRYHSKTASLLDLVQEGNLGLLRALEKFDPTHGVPFSAYAQYWIRAMILRFVMENHRMVKVGRTRASRRLFFELARERARLLQAGHEATPAALSDRLGIDVTEVERVVGALRAEESLDGPREGLGWHDVLPADGTDPEAETARGLLHDRLRDAIDAFADTVDGERDQALLFERLLSEDPVSLATLGRRYGVSRERMRQLEARLKRRLEAHLIEQLGDDIQFAAA